EGAVAVGALARLALRLRIEPPVSLQVVHPEGMAVGRGDRVGAAADVDPLALRVVAGGGVDAPGWLRPRGGGPLPPVRRRVVEPDLLVAVGEERLLARGKVKERVAVAALRGRRPGPEPVPLAGGRLEDPRAGVGRGRLQPALALRQGTLPVLVKVRH